MNKIFSPRIKDVFWLTSRNAWSEPDVVLNYANLSGSQGKSGRVIWALIKILFKSNFTKVSDNALMSNNDAFKFFFFFFLEE